MLPGTVLLSYSAVLDLLNWLFLNPVNLPSQTYIRLMRPFAGISVTTNFKYFAGTGGDVLAHLI